MSSHLTPYHAKVGGQVLPANVAQQMHGFSVESSLNLPSVATLTFTDSKMDLVDGTLLEPGKTLELFVGGGKDEQKLFDGEIVELEPVYDYPHVYCVVRAFDRLHRLNRGRFVRDFQDMSDADIAKRLAGEAKLGAAGVKPSSPVHKYVFQDNETNLVFLQRRAAMLGYVVYARDKDLHFGPPESQRELSLKWGKEGLSEFRPRLSTLGQPTEITVRGWDPLEKKAVRGQAGAGAGQPKIGEAKDRVAMAQVYGAASELLSTTIRDAKHAEAVAKGEANKRSGAYVQAEGVCGGNPQLLAGVMANIDNIGDRFKGKYLVTNALHVVNADKNYSTRFSVTAQHADTLLGLVAPSAPNVQAGLAIGIVTNNDDPKNLGRVKVKYPSLSEDKESDWARVVSVGGGDGRGLEFLPEVNDEVLVGFELGDIHHPYVIGGLWNGKDKPPRGSSDVISGGKVERRLLRSRTGHLIVLDDSNASPGISISDSKGNKIHIDSKTGNISVTAKGDIKLAAEKNIAIEAQANLELRAPNVKINGSAIVEIDGGLIKIG